MSPRRFADLLSVSTASVTSALHTLEQAREVRPSSGWGAFGGEGAAGTGHGASATVPVPDFAVAGPAETSALECLERRRDGIGDRCGRAADEA